MSSLHIVNSKKEDESLLKVFFLSQMQKVLSPRSSGCREDTICCPAWKEFIKSSEVSPFLKNRLRFANLELSPLTLKKFTGLIRFRNFPIACHTA